MGETEKAVELRNHTPPYTGHQLNILQMETVVQSSDLMALIFASIYITASRRGTVQEKEGYQCLSRCARVNKLWHDESCRFLWKRQLNLTHVMRLLTPGISVIHADMASYNLNTLLSRLDHYSKWICDLTSGREDPDYIYDAYLLAHSRPLFPHLEKLTIEFDNIPNTAYLAAFATMGPSLKSLSLEHYYWPPGNVFVILDRLKMKVVQLNQLQLPTHVTATHLSHDDRHYLVDVVSQQQSLTSLSLGPVWLDCNVFCAIGSLPRLSTLTIWDDAKGDTQLVASTLYGDNVLKLSKQQNLWFPSLTHLSLAFHGPAVTNLLKSISFTTKLEFLDLWLQFRTEDQMGSTLPCIIPSQSSFSNVEDIEVKVGDSDNPRIPRLTAASLKPFSSCSLLRSLTVSTSRIPQMDDNDLLELLKNWPRLSHLHFIDMLCVNRIDRWCNFSLGLIAKIPAICREMSSMTLPVSHSREPLEVHRPQYQVLRTLDLGLSFFFDSLGPGWEEEVMLIAAYLAVVTPFSCEIGFAWHHREGYKELAHEIPDDEWDMLVKAHEQTESSIHTYLRVSRMSLGIAAAFSERGNCKISSSQNDIGFSCN